MSIDLQLYTDADFAGCPRTQRSTTGIHLELAGDTTKFPLAGVSKTQTAMAVSTPEAELNAGNAGLIYEMIPAEDVCDLFLRRSYKSLHQEDNQAMIRVVKSGRNPTMRHLSRVHRVSVASLYERYQEEGREIKYCDTKDMAADIYTKHFTSADKWRSAVKLINVVTKDEQKKMKFKLEHQ